MQACGPKKGNLTKKASAQAITLKGNFSAQTIQQFDSASILIFIDSFPKFSNLKNELFSFYRGRTFAYDWFDESGMIEQAGNLFNSIKNIEDEGLDSSKQLYLLQMANLMEHTSGNSTDSAAVFTELMLSAQYLWYAKNVWSGLDEETSLSLDWLLPRNKIAYGTLLDSLIAGKDLLASPPVYRQYYLLKEQLLRYRLKAAADTLQIILNKNETVKIADAGATVLAIRQKLFLLGDLPTNNNSAVFDSSLHVAVQQFQDRHGLNITGIVKAAEVAELNVPIQKELNRLW